MSCINQIRNITKNPLPPLEEIAEGVLILLRDVKKTSTQNRRDFYATPLSSGTGIGWFPDTREDHEPNLGLNKHLGAEGAMPPGWVQYPKGAKSITTSYNSPAGAIAAIIKLRFLIT